MMGSMGRVGYCILVPDFYLMLYMVFNAGKALLWINRSISKSNQTKLIDIIVVSDGIMAKFEYFFSILGHTYHFCGGDSYIDLIWFLSALFLCYLFDPKIGTNLFELSCYLWIIHLHVAMTIIQNTRFQWVLSCPAFPNFLLIWGVRHGSPFSSTL